MHCVNMQGSGTSGSGRVLCTETAAAAEAAASHMDVLRFGSCQIILKITFLIYKV